MVCMYEDCSFVIEYIYMKIFIDFLKLLYGMFCMCWKDNNFSICVIWMSRERFEIYVWRILVDRIYNF